VDGQRSGGHVPAVDWMSNLGERLSVHTLFPPLLFMEAWMHGGWIRFRNR
jgi:hypothetical protein